MLFIALGTLMFAFNACKKKTVTYEIKGTANDISSSVPLSGATVTLTLVSTSNNALNKVLTTTTAADGSYSFSFDRDKYSQMTLKMTKNLYFEKSYDFTLDDLKVDEANVYNFDVNSMSWVKLHITGDGSKTIRYIQTYGLTGCSECCPSGDQFLYNIDSLDLYFLNKGNTQFGVYFSVIGTSITGQEIVNTTPLDTTTISIGF